MRGDTGGPHAAESAPQAMRDELADDLHTLHAAGLARKLRNVERTSGSAEVVCDGRRVVDFASNDYLGLASDARIAQAAVDAAQKYSVGAAAARLVSGNHPLHVELESVLARFKNTQSALLFSSGYMANVGAIPALVGRRDVIYADELNHASLIDACRLARSELRVLPHCDVRALRAALAEDATRFRRRLVVVDAMFSMDGDLYPLDELVQTCREFGAWSYVDDAHGTGVLGANGRGAAEHWGVEGEMDVLMGTLGKAIGVSGAFIAGSAELVEYLLHRARSFVFTTGTPALLAASTLEALRIVAAEPWRRGKLRDNARHLRKELGSMGVETRGDEDSHIVPVVLRDTERTMRTGAALYERGFLVGAIRPPTVALGSARLRITLSSAHTTEQVSALAAALRELVGEKNL